MTTTLLGRAALAPKATERRFLSLPTWIRAAAAQTGGALSLVEQVIPAGFASPWHLHRDEDESFYVIDGEVTVNLDGRWVRLGAGDYAFGPRGVPHGFRIEGSAPARILLMTTGGRFAAFIEEASTPADEAAPAPPDLAALAAAAERNGLAILGPMPA